MSINISMIFTTLYIDRYNIPRFDIARNDNQEEEPDPNQGNLFENKDDEKPKKGDEKKKDNPDAGLFFNSDDE